MEAAARAGASVEQVGSHSFVLTCVKRSQLQHVGYIVYNVLYSHLFIVEGVSGAAEARGRAYRSASLPPKR